MPKLRSLICGLLVLTSAQVYAQDEPYAVPFEVGQRVEITLAKPYRTGEGVRVHDTSTRLADKDLLTLAAGGQEERLAPSGERGRVQGLLTAVDDAWLTLDLGEKQPLLRIPRVAIVEMVHWEPLGLLPRTAEPLSTGPRVRLVSTELSRKLVTGRLVAMDDDALLVKVAGSDKPLRLRRSGIERLEVSRGERSNAAAGALIGVAALGIPVAALAAAHGSDLCWMGSTSCPASDLAPVAGFLVGAVLGAPIGALIGSAFKSEHWERVPVSVAVAPQRRGARAALTLRF